MSLPAQPSRAIDALTKAIRQVMEMNPDRKFEGIGNCLAGRTDVGARSLIFAPNLRWPVVRLKSRIEHDTCASPKCYCRKKAQSLTI
jgi:predicted NBD/HSP70 family sugar kinase